MTDTERLDRERAFHDERFADGMVREAQDKYYVAIQHGRARFEDRVWALAEDADVLEVGCGTGAETARLVDRARSVSGIDISPVAVEAAKALGVTAEAGDAEATPFADDSFDLIFGAGIVHHLHVERFAQEAARLLRPGGRAVFWEPLGHNMAFNAYRRLTPAARTEDEHPLLKGDLSVLETQIGPTDNALFGLTTLPAAFLPENALRRAYLRVAGALDATLVRVPALKWQAWYALTEAQKRS